MSAEHAHAIDADTDPAVILAAAEDRVARLREAAGQPDAAPECTARLIDALVALAGEQDAHGDDDATAVTLAEAESLMPDPLPAPEAWHALAVRLHRMKAGFYQRRDQHAEAVDSFEAALGDIPFQPGEGGRDVNALRIQLLVRLARSRLALGQAAETLAEAPQCDVVLDSLDGAMPANALNTIRAATLENRAVALAQLGNTDEADKAFRSSLKLIDGVGAPELMDLRERVRHSWAAALSAAGRDADASAMLGRTEPSAEFRAAAAKSQQGHHHHHHDHGNGDHRHDHPHGQNGHHHHHDGDDHHGHGQSCGCSDCAS